MLTSNLWADVGFIIVLKGKVWIKYNTYDGPGQSGTLFSENNCCSLRKFKLNKEVSPCLDVFPKNVTISVSCHKEMHNNETYTIDAFLGLYNS